MLIVEIPDGNWEGSRAYIKWLFQFLPGKPTPTMCQHQVVDFFLSPRLQVIVGRFDFAMKVG